MELGSSNHRDDILLKLAKLQEDDFSDPQQILAYARLLRGMTFNDVLELGIKGNLPNTYGEKSRKGGMGNLLEEHYFGYAANSDSLPDFPNAGVELKLSPIEKYTPRGKKEDAPEQVKAGERLVLSMIPNDREIAPEYQESELYKKSQLILLISYLRNREVSRTEQEIIMANLLIPSQEDLKVIEEDYRTIAQYIREGRGHELSEGLTHYLGACTKGATAAKSLRKQFYPLVHKDGTQEFIPAKSRAFSFKQSYMTSIVQRFKAEQEATDRLLNAGGGKQEIEDTAAARINRFIGKTAEEIQAEIASDVGLFNKKGINKSAFPTLVLRMLGSISGKIEEFEKAGILVRVIRLNRKGRPTEHLKLGNIKLSRLTNAQSWEDSKWYEMLTVPRYFLVVFQEDETGHYVMRGGKFWTVPMGDVGDEAVPGDKSKTAYGYWLDTIEKASAGVQFTYTGGHWENNFLNASDHPVCHIRSSARKAAYRFKDGTEIGNAQKNGDRLPDGQIMTKQALWLNKDYIKNVIQDLMG